MHPPASAACYVDNVALPRVYPGEVIACRTPTTASLSGDKSLVDYRLRRHEPFIDPLAQLQHL